MKITYVKKVKLLRTLSSGTCFQCGDNLYRFIKVDPEGEYLCYCFNHNSIVTFGEIEIDVVVKEIELVVSDVNS